VIVIVCLLLFFTTIESNIDKFDEEGNFEDFEEDQGQANQGKPSKLFAYLYPSFTYACFQRFFMQDALFLIAITPLWQFVGDLAPQVTCYHPFG
jgi:hypothetical protein